MAEQQTKVCPKCRTKVPLSGYVRSVTRTDGLQGWCKECTNQVQRARLARLRGDLIKELGGCCRRCGFSDARALQVDHLNGDGSKDPMRGRPSSKPFYDHVLANRERFQLLCANCNVIKRLENEEHGKGGRPPKYSPLTDDQYRPGPGRPKELQQWYDRASKEEIAQTYVKALAGRSKGRR